MMARQQNMYQLAEHIELYMALVSSLALSLHVNHYTLLYISYVSVLNRAVRIKRFSHDTAFRVYIIIDD